MPLAEELALADRQIAAVKACILGQQLIVRLAADSLATGAAKALLRTMPASQVALRAHRQRLLARLVGQQSE
jgi:hypothetical protein